MSAAIDIRVSPSGLAGIDRGRHVPRTSYCVILASCKEVRLTAQSASTNRCGGQGGYSSATIRYHSCLANFAGVATFFVSPLLHALSLFARVMTGALRRKRHNSTNTWFGFNLCYCPIACKLLPEWPPGAVLAHRRLRTRTIMSVILSLDSLSGPKNSKAPYSIIAKLMQSFRKLAGR